MLKRFSEDSPSHPRPTLQRFRLSRTLSLVEGFIAGVQRGIEQADRGELVEHKDVLARIDGLFHS